MHICFKIIYVTLTAFPFELNIEEDYILEAKDSSTIHECGSGERVSVLAKCNGVLECLDASDEMMCEPHGWSFFIKSVFYKVVNSPL